MMRDVGNACGNQEERSRFHAPAALGLRLDEATGLRLLPGILALVGRRHVYLNRFLVQSNCDKRSGQVRCSLVK